MVARLWTAAAAGWFVLAAPATAISEEVSSESQGEGTSASELSGGSVDCVGASSESVAKGMLFKIQNQCEAPVSCTVTWELRCGGGDAPAEARKQTVPIWAKSDGSVSASAASCSGDTWSIENPSWECKTTTQK